MRWIRRLLACLLAMMPVALCAQQAKPTNQEILNAALRDEVGSRQGTCKIYIQTVMARVGVTLGAGYSACYLAVGTEVSGNDAIPGDIIQVSRELSHSKINEFVEGYHTAVVEKNNGDGTFNVIDSNWGLDGEIQHRPNWNPYTHAASIGMSVYFYRLGRVDGTAIGQLPNGAVNQKFVDMANEIITAYGLNATDVTAYDNKGTAYVHEWEHFGTVYTVQDVLIRNAGLTHERSLFVLGHDGHTERVLVVKEGFYWLFMLHDTGVPLGNEELSQSGAGRVYQRFDRAIAHWDNQNRVLTLKDYAQNVIARYTSSSLTVAIATTGGDDTYAINEPVPDPVIPLTNVALVIQPAEPGYRYQLGQGQERCLTFLNYDTIVTR